MAGWLLLITNTNIFGKTNIKFLKELVMDKALNKVIKIKTQEIFSQY